MKVGDNMGKIQTGLRLPEKVYDNLQARAGEMGISINQLILVLVHIGIRFLDEGVIPQQLE